MDNKQDENDSYFIALTKPDVIIESATTCDDGNIFGWPTYCMKTHDPEDLCEYMLTTNYSPNSSKEQK